MTKYNKEDLQKIVEKSFSIAEVCRKLNIRPAGGNYKSLKVNFLKFDIDTSHFTGQGWNVGVNFKFFGKKYSLDEILIKNSTYASTTKLKTRLFDAGLKEDRCEECGLTEWNGEKISLHLDHVNGDNLDNRIENLRILCPNCHSQTETYCNSKIKCSSSELRLENYNNRIDKSETVRYIKVANHCSCGKEIRKESNECLECKNKKSTIKNYCSCGNEIRKNSKMCPTCDKIRQRKVKNRPTKYELRLMISETSLEAVGRVYGVTGNAVKKWLK